MKDHTSNPIVGEVRSLVNIFEGSQAQEIQVPLVGVLLQITNLKPNWNGSCREVRTTSSKGQNSKIPSAGAGVSFGGPVIGWLDILLIGYCLQVVFGFK